MGYGAILKIIMKKGGKIVREFKEEKYGSNTDKVKII